ncbi:MAG TPA: type II secretion system protein GspL [Methylococcaceae bacterium]|nr:type II secretion system protein GspL [Methylococcaceae bacterium]
MNRFAKLVPFALPEDKSFFAWWKGELAFLVPEAFRLWWRRRQARLLILPAGEDIELRLWTVEGARFVDKRRLEEAGPALLANVLAEHGAQEVERVLLLPPDRVLRRTVSLPPATRENLSQVVGYELDRFTPFKANALYHDVRPLSDGAPGEALRVEFVAVLREELDAALQSLENAGLLPERVDVQSADGVYRDGGFDLLPLRYRQRGGSLPRILTAVFATVLSVSLIAVGALPTVLDNRFLDELRDEQRRLNQASRTVEALREQAQNLQRAAAFVLDKKIGNPSALAVLQDISQRLPDQAWVASLQIRERRIEMQGQAASASALIALLEASPYLNNTAFLSPVTPDPASGQERFRLGADLAAPAAGDDYRRISSAAPEEDGGEDGATDDEADLPPEETPSEAGDGTE